MVAGLQPVAFVSAHGGGGAIKVVDLSNGQVRTLAELPHGAERLAWSPDGRRIAFLQPIDGKRPTIDLPPSPGAPWRTAPIVTDQLVFRVNGGGDAPLRHEQAFTVAAEGGTPRPACSGEVSFGGYGGAPRGVAGPPSWSPDSRRIVLSGQPDPDDFHNANHMLVFSCDPSNATTRQLTGGRGRADRAMLAPDGAHIAWLASPGDGTPYGETVLVVADAEGHGAKALSSALDRTVVTYAWDRDGRSLVFGYEDTGGVAVVRVMLDGHVTELARGGGSAITAYNGEGFDISTGPAGSAVFPVQGPEALGDLAISDHAGTRTLLTLNRDYFAAHEAAVIETRWLRSTLDGTPVQAFLLMPPGFDPHRRYPMIMEIHGGPYAAWGSHFDYEKERMAASGYVVLLVNQRGSTGYGHAFTDAIEAGFPAEADTADLLSATDALAREPWIDPDRLFLSGGSGGGVLAAWLTGKSHRFRAAAVSYLVSDWASWALTSDEPYAFVASFLGGVSPWGAGHGRYWAHSPLSRVDHVATPTLVMVGAQDRRTSPDQSLAYYTALKLCGVDSRLAIFPGEGHGLRDVPSDHIAKVTAILDWFASHGGAPLPNEAGGHTP